MNTKWMAALFAMSLVFPGVAEEHTFDSDGTEIYYRNDGAGEPVILIHGYTVNGGINWRMPGIVRMLEEDGYRVIVPDMRGHGKSGEPAGAVYGIQMVEDVRRLMDHLGLDTAHIAGYSMGGMITIKFATMYPERVKSATIGGMGWVDPGSMGERGPQYANVSQTLVEVYDDFSELETTAEAMQELSMPLTVLVGTKDEGQLVRVNNWLGIDPDLNITYIQDAQHGDCVFKKDFKTALMAFLDAHK